LKDRFAFAGINPLKNERPTIQNLTIESLRRENIIDYSGYFYFGFIFIK